ncbi:hypothetical protein GQ457_12G027440 [Hibiscus cannabinus]
MEVDSIAKFLQGKIILVTGATGFLSKVFVEKILRLQPKVNKLYLLLRAQDEESALQRLNDEIINTELFKVLRRKWGSEFNHSVLSKIVAVAGDISFENLGVKDFMLRQKMWNELEIIVNVAATTDFYERYDVALDINTFGVLNVLNFGKKCDKVKLFLHVSTGKFKGEFPLVIIRPSMISSTYKQPFPGWIEGLRTIDIVIMGYGKGKLTCFPGNLNSALDVIPVDMVVNAMVVAMEVHYANHQYSREVIYHVSSSLQNPMKYSDIQKFAYCYFTKNPWVDRNGQTVKIGELKVISRIDLFFLSMQFKYVFPLKVFYLINTLCCQRFKRVYTKFDRQIKFVMRLAQLYKPYAFFTGIFDVRNLEKLEKVARERGIDGAEFDFNSRNIDWEDYIMNVHIPGLVKHAIRS